MKGDGNIIIMRFIGTGYKNQYQAKVKIYHKNKKIHEENTYNGIIKINLKENEIYKIKAIFLNELIEKNIYASKKYKYTFTFSNIKYCKAITISLVDYNYKLPIKGVIKLWQKQ